MRCLFPLLVLLGCCARAPHRQASTHTPPAPSSAEAPRQPVASPALLVLIVDQLGSWVFETRRVSLAPDGAFAKLAREGVYARELRYEHATTSTAPGHAALYTGLPPRGSGIFANERFDESVGKSVSFLFDPTSRLVQGAALEGKGSSAASLQAETLADALRAQRPNAQIVSLSLKDRAAVPGGGRHPDASIWFDPGLGTFVSSTAFHGQLPAFALAANAELSKAYASVWQPLDAAWLRAHSPTSDDQAGEGDLGLGVQFPYELAKSKNRGLVFRGQPVADRALLALAQGVLDELHPETQPERPFLLALSLSTFDYVGHVHGPDSWESWEALRELDLALADFIAALERRLGARLSIMLTADHGVGMLPETDGNARARPWCVGQAPDAYERPCSKGTRLYRDELETLTKKVAAKALGTGNWIRAVIEPFVYVTPEVAALPEERRRALENAIIGALEQHPGIARVFPARAFAGACPDASDDSLSALVCRSLPAGSNDLYVAVSPGSFFDPRLVHAHGMNHGSPYLYDRVVPAFVRSGTRARAGTSISSRISPADFTATAAVLLGITPPPGAAAGRDLLRL
jgi:arylsulfatase A-like enzyme